MFVSFLLLFIRTYVNSQNNVHLKNDHLEVRWKKQDGYWKIDNLSVKLSGKWISISNVSGENTILYSAVKPSEQPVDTFRNNQGELFHNQKGWTEVLLNTAGTAYNFYYTDVRVVQQNKLLFSYKSDIGVVTAEWRLDKSFPSDIIVSQSLKANKPGYYSLATPVINAILQNDISWATVPGYFQGNTVQSDFIQAFAYNMGIPSRPVVYRDRCATALSPIIETKQGVSFSVIADTGLGRDPWAYNKDTHRNWYIGLSHQSRKGDFSPTLYYPVLGESHSKLNEGQQVDYSFRYSLTSGDWFKSYKHTVYDIYKFGDGLALRKNRQSLTNRIEQMHKYLINPSTSLWNIESYEGLKIGAQSYGGGVKGSSKDAMKNSDYGAMWYLASATGDSMLRKSVLPYALNFKIAQQIDTGFFKGAIKGQYYLAKSKRFVEEWAPVIEPMGVTYYTMLDIGNILLFEPDNASLKALLQNGAEFLMRTQRPDGSWPVAYDMNREEVYKDIPDARPTFYGLLVAYRILKDPKYLVAAIKGAKWYIEKSVYNGYFIGVCGDARYARDFATGQSAQAFLDLFDVTKDSTYLNAAIFTARIYTNSIYTRPVASTKKKDVKGKVLEDWQISQAGLSFEHGGITGSANGMGPILLASHAGLFIRMFALTGDSLFVDMARTAAIGRDAFVNSATSVASYYWLNMNNGAGKHPHHAWWQIGWITDYLMSEAQLRSDNNIVFPRGFVTPKVGPHQTYGFEPGVIYGNRATLFIKQGFVTTDNPSIDCILAKSIDKKKIFIILLNSSAHEVSFKYRINFRMLDGQKKIRSVRSLNQKKIIKENSFTIAPFGIQVLEATTI
jgi:hypothetical protein